MGKDGAPGNHLYREEQSRLHISGGGTVIPRANTSAKAGKPTGTETEPGTRAEQESLIPEKKKRELEIERAALQSDIDKQKAEAERDLLRATLERERVHATGLAEQVKQLGEFIPKLIPQPSANCPEGKSGYVTELVGYHALKRVSADITRGISAVVGLGNDVRILIVDGLDYAPGDIPFIEVTSQLSVFDVRCRKQVATNKELADLAIEKEERGEDESARTTRSGATRLASLSASPGFLPALTSAPTALPAIPGIAITAADIPGSFRSDYSVRDRNVSLKNEGLIAAVAGSLRSEKRNVYVYNFYSMHTTGPQSKLMNMYAGVLDCSGRLAQSRNRVLSLISKKNGLIAELKTSLENHRSGTPSAEGERSIADIRDGITRETLWLDRAHMEVLVSDAIHAELGTFVKNITTANAPQRPSKLAQAVFREKVHELGITHLLCLDVLSSGGESVTRKWIFGTGTTSYLGGAVVSYVLSRVEGDVLASDTLPVLYSFGFDPAGQRHSPLKQVRFEKQEQKK